VRVKSRVDPAAWSQKIKVLTWKTIVKEEV